MSETDITKMKVADLKKELKARGISTTGNKIELQERLQTALLDGDSVLEDSAISEELLDEDVLNDDDLDDETKSLLESNEEAILKSPKHPSPEPPITTKKVVLKRNLSLSSSLSDTTGESPLPEPPKKIIKITSDIPELKENNIQSTENDSENDKKKVVKLSELTIKDRLDMRAKRFGAPIPSNEKKLARAERFGLDIANVTTENSKKIESTGPPTTEVLKKRAERFGVAVASSLVKVQKEEKLLKRQERFGATPSTKTLVIAPVTSVGDGNADYAEKARLRLERFKTDVK